MEFKEFEEYRNELPANPHDGYRVRFALCSGYRLCSLEFLPVRRTAEGENLCAGQWEVPDTCSFPRPFAEQAGGGKRTYPAFSRAVFHLVARQGGYRVEYPPGVVPVRRECVPLLQGLGGKGVLQPYNLGQYQPEHPGGQRGVRLQQLPVCGNDLRTAVAGQVKQHHGTEPCNPLPAVELGQVGQ